MNLTLNTPALLFPAISLLLLAYTNRFLALAALIRNLHDRNKEQHDPMLAAQIVMLRKRVNLIRLMQFLGISSLFGCVLTMFLLYAEFNLAADYVFGISLTLMLLSLAFSLREIQVSINALNLHLGDMEE